VELEPHSSAAIAAAVALAGPEYVGLAHDVARAQVI
jgi:hypothetical protein